MTTYIAYLDESGTHQGAAVSVMPGFVGDERQWRKFQKRSGKLFKRYRADIFHTIAAVTAGRGYSSTHSRRARSDLIYFAQRAK
jgi:hypothetical protein